VLDVWTLGSDTLGLTHLQFVPKGADGRNAEVVWVTPWLRRG
jgi:hypothetical protein